MPWGPSGPCSFTGISEVRATPTMIRMKGNHHATRTSCFAVADRLPYPNATQLRACRGCRRLHEIRAADARPRLSSGCTQRRVDAIDARPREAARREARTRGARQAERGEALDHL